MEDSILIETRDGSVSFLPGDTVEGTVAWHLDPPPQTMELRLLWYTEGKGDQDLGIVETISFATPAADDHRSFSVRLPAGPYSFSGKLISLVWALEAVAEPGSRAQRLNLVLSPLGREIPIYLGAAGESAG